ncbi:FERM domain containing expanded isoform 2-T7 [Glossina fuscipes fuscipes]
MLDTELFGLAVLIDGEYMFADPESKLSKYGPKSWRSSHTHGLDANGRPLLELHFRVQFYIESPLMLKDETTRHNYYLQLKYNALNRDIPREYSEQSMILLAGLALQADMGDAPSLATTTGTATGVEGNSSAEGSDGKEEQRNYIDLLGNKLGTRIADTTSPPPAATTTLLKISKRANMVNERVLRLSSYMTSASQAGSVGGVTTVNSIDSLKKGMSLAAEPSSTASSTSSISRGPSSASTNASISTNASSRTDYFRLEDYLPVRLRTAWASSALRACHRENRGMLTADAELHYIQHACVVHECINAHTFRMRLAKNENGPGNSWFVVYAKGIKIFGGGVGSESTQQQITFLWPNITKLSFERKKFEIRSGESKITLYATSDEKNKMLLSLCKETHQFSMKIAARLKEVIKKEEEESNCLHACYIYSRSLHLPPYKNKNDQRISVISSTSSNTTSGIVSDRVHSEDELEIMINSPPAPIAAPSTESLALAHLLDRPSVSRQTSSVGQVSLKDLEEHLAALSVRQAQKQRISHAGNESPTELSNTSSAGNSSSTSGGSLPTTASQRNAGDSSTSTESPNSQHNIGSQCSSTCSTVVVAPSTSENPNSLATLAARTSLNTTNSSIGQRRNSTSSSLELGFSHTAQNSTLSEPDSTCIDHDFMQATRDENESVSGVYTLAHGAPPTETSGVYTMHSSELTGQSSEMAESEKSSHYGIFQPSKSEISDDHMRLDHSNLQDSVDGGNYRNKGSKAEDFRLRSDSNISTSGSFRGDGSDPTDNKHNLLSAEELTDLIVGRGTYPNRKTVSGTLDSDCDYVTLPLSMTGESYLQGHQDTAPTEDHVEDLINDLLPTDPPAPPQRIDSNMHNFTNIRTRSPPPYNARHHKTGLCGPPVRTTSTANSLTEISNKPTSSLTTVPTQVPLLSTFANVKPSTIKVSSKAKPSATASLAAALKCRDPPPYPTANKPRPTSLISVAPANVSLNSKTTSTNAQLNTVVGSTASLKSEEITARFITTRPQINILKAHASIVNENAKLSYAAPTNCSSATSSTGSICSHHLTSHLSQHSLNNSNYVSGSQTSLTMGHHLQSAPATPTHSTTISAAAVAHAAAAAGVLPGSIGIPVVPYALHGPHKSLSPLHQQQSEQMKQSAPRTCVLLPVIKPRQYLPPPPPSLPRQPPPPPPTQFAGLYPNQLARKQLELYQQQLCSDVDYVIYPLQDPAVSQQEYLDAKQGSLLAAMAQNPPPHPHSYLAAYHHAAASGAWETCKGHAIYRSTPYLPLALSTHSRYASTQNLSDTYVQLPSPYSPMYSPSMASLCSSYEPPPPPPLHPAAALAAAAVTANINAGSGPLFARSRSDDNILNSLDSLPKVKRLPPPPPPPYVDRRLKKPPMPAPTEKPPPIPTKPIPNVNSVSQRVEMITSSRTTALRTHQLPPRKPMTLTGRNAGGHMTKTSSGAQWAGERPKPNTGLGNNQSSSILAQLQASAAVAHHRAQTTKESNINHSNAGTATTPISAPANELDIALLREKSKHLDLPLISALCNDRSLLKQTKVLINPRSTLRQATNCSNTNSTAFTTVTSGLTTLETASSSTSISKGGSLLVNGAATTTSNGSTTTIVGATTMSPMTNRKLLAANSTGKSRKTSISHRHPNDKLPPLPMQLAEANNYVMDPAILKHHKSYNSHT